MTLDVHKKWLTKMAASVQTYNGRTRKVTGYNTSPEEDLPTGADEYISLTRPTVFFEPTDRRKAIKPFNGKHNLAYTSPNVIELRAMANFMKPDMDVIKSNELDEIVELSKVIIKHVRVLIVTRGSKGCMTIKRKSVFEPYVKELDVHVYSTDILSTVENVSGAGDCFASGFIHGSLQGLQESQSVSIGFETAKQALLCKETVPLRFNNIIL